MTGGLRAAARRTWEGRELARLRREIRAHRPGADPAGSGTRWSEVAVDRRTRSAVDAARRVHPPGRDLVVGRFDEHGRLWGPFGDLRGLGFEAIPEEAYRPRRQISVDLVLADGDILVRKGFRGDRARFLREWCAFLRLAGHARVPRLRRADEPRTRLYKDLIRGRRVREILIAGGALLRDEDLEGDPELAGLGERARIELVCRRAIPVVRRCLSSGVLRDIEAQLDAVHARGVTHFGFTPGNVILDAVSRPWLFDFDGARIHRRAAGPWFSFRRGQDRRRFDRHYGTGLSTGR